jgi:PAS domain S-box-containing protein
LPNRFYVRFCSKFIEELIGLLANFFQLSKNHMLHKTLHIEQESYQVLVESIRDYAIVLLDPEGHITSWNRGAEEIYGYQENEILGLHFSRLYPKSDNEKELPVEHLQKARSLGQYEDEGWRVRKEGSHFWANVVLAPLRNRQGRLTGYGKVTRDITLRKVTEKEIEWNNRELRKQLQEIQTEVYDYKHALDESAIVAITNQKGIITHVNENFCRISKYTKEELLGQDHRIINSTHHSKDFIRSLWTTIAHGKIWRGELKNRAKDGTYYWVDTTIVPFLNAKGKPYQYLAIRSDITQRKLAEEQLHRINEELEHKVKERTYELTQALEREKELNEMKSRFVSMASHEFRTPLSAILSSVALIEHYTQPEQEEKRNKHIERIKSSVRNLTSILDDFLSLEKLEQGRVEVNCTQFNLKEFIEDVVEDMEGIVKKKEQTVTVQFTGEPVVCQDKKILRNVLLNLLSNAVKYSPDKRAINVKAAVQDSKVQLSVTDEGIGIPEEAQKNLFSKFYRAKNVINIQGTGLGLHIVKRYVELLCGTIDFVSKVNSGTTFVVAFPKNNC